jgi:hypothetical protein
MTEPQPTSTPEIDHAALEQKWREQERRADELRRSNKAVLFDTLATAGIDTVVVTFDGYGDSGQIENIDARAGAETVTVPSNDIEIARSEWGSSEIDRSVQSVHDAIATLVYDMLRQTHSGWENNDGAYGEFTFDVAERTIVLDYNERYTSSEHTSHTF